MSVDHSPPPQDRRPQRRWTALVIVGLLAAWWIIPSDVARLVILKRDVLLGRYSESRLIGLLIFTVPLLLVAGAFWSRDRARRSALFKSTGAFGLTLVGLTVAAIVVGPSAGPRYVEEDAGTRTGWPHDHNHGIVRRRPPNLRYELTLYDRPSMQRSYAGHPEGAPTMDVTLTSDHRGFRNLLAPEAEPDAYDLVTLGDSFTEGSHVSDDQTWPRLLADELGVTLYNLGVSGSSPRTYLNNLLALGSELQPSTVICMIYEGNDFKGDGGHASHAHGEDDQEAGDELASAGEVADGGAQEGLYDNLRNRFKESRLGRSVRKSFLSTLGSIGADRPLPDHPALTWMPVRIASDDRNALYTFKPKDLLRLKRTRGEITASDGWADAVRACREIKAVCNAQGIRLVFTYAPTVAHVVMPVIRSRVQAEALHAFVSFRESDLPPPEDFELEFYEQIDNTEQAFTDFCAQEGLEFVSPTAELQRHVAAGEQLYFAYDEHWTPLGTAVVAGLLADHLQPAASRPGTR